VITVVFRSAFIRPHGGLLSNQTAFLESQPIHTIQEVLRRTLSKITDDQTRSFLSLLSREFRLVFNVPTPMPEQHAMPV
jgi:hypothetical protein